MQIVVQVHTNSQSKLSFFFHKFLALFFTFKRSFILLWTFLLPYLKMLTNHATSAGIAALKCAVLCAEFNNTQHLPLEPALGTEWFSIGVPLSCKSMWLSWTCFVREGGGYGFVQDGCGARVEGLALFRMGVGQVIACKQVDWRLSWLSGVHCTIVWRPLHLSPTPWRPPTGNRLDFRVCGVSSRSWNALHVSVAQSKSIRQDLPWPLLVKAEQSNMDSPGFLPLTLLLFLFF
jgi:hypothetical protein